MIEQIKEVQMQGFKPIIYIESMLLSPKYDTRELIKIYKKAKELNIPVYSENNIPQINRIRKAFIFRYGFIPIPTEVMIKRKGGKIVSGNLRLPDNHL